jgi:magnesium chelatase family protein
VQRYRGRISGPLLDRIDVHLEVPALEYRDFMDGEEGEKTEKIRRRVKRARAIQRKRFAGNGTVVNAAMGSTEVRAHCRLDRESDTLLCSAAETLGLSARGATKILKIARTVADLAGAGSISPEHLAEAIQYRSLDRGVL